MLREWTGVPVPHLLFLTGSTSIGYVILALVWIPISK